MITQAYEISTAEEASAISAIGVDHIGVLVGDGRFPRELPVSAASEIGAAIEPPSKFSALFLNSDISLIVSWARELDPSIVHLKRRTALAERCCFAQTHVARGCRDEKYTGVR